MRTKKIILMLILILNFRMYGINISEKQRLLIIMNKQLDIALKPTISFWNIDVFAELGYSLSKNEEFEVIGYTIR